MRPAPRPTATSETPSDHEPGRIEAGAAPEAAELLRERLDDGEGRVGGAKGIASESAGGESRKAMHGDRADKRGAKNGGHRREG